MGLLIVILTIGYSVAPAFACANSCGSCGVVHNVVCGDAHDSDSHDGDDSDSGHGHCDGGTCHI